MNKKISTLIKVCAVAIILILIAIIVFSPQNKIPKNIAPKTNIVNASGCTTETCYSNDTNYCYVFNPHGVGGCRNLVLPYTINNGSNRLLVVTAVNGFESPLPATITYSKGEIDTELTQAVIGGNTDSFGCSIWYLTNPDIGEHNITANFPNGSAVHKLMAMSFNGIDLRATGGPIGNTLAINEQTHEENISSTISTIRKNSIIIDVFGISPNAGFMNAQLPIKNIFTGNNLEKNISTIATPNKKSIFDDIFGHTAFASNLISSCSWIPTPVDSSPTISGNTSPFPNDIYCFWDIFGAASYKRARSNHTAMSWEGLGTGTNLNHCLAEIKIKAKRFLFF